MSFDDTAQCQSLCQQQEENGCCTISKKYGCLWLPGGTVTTAADYGELAISCSLKNWLSLRLTQHSKDFHWVDNIKHCRFHLYYFYKYKSLYAENFQDLY